MQDIHDIHRNTVLGPGKETSNNKKAERTRSSRNNYVSSAKKENNNTMNIDNGRGQSNREIKNVIKKSSKSKRQNHYNKKQQYARNNRKPNNSDKNSSRPSNEAKKKNSSGTKGKKEKVMDIKSDDDALKYMNNRLSNENDYLHDIVGGAHKSSYSTSYYRSIHNQKRILQLTKIIDDNYDDASNTYKNPYYRSLSTKANEVYVDSQTFNENININLDNVDGHNDDDSLKINKDERDYHIDNDASETRFSDHGSPRAGLSDTNEAIFIQKHNVVEYEEDVMSIIRDEKTEGGTSEESPVIIIESDYKENGANASFNTITTHVDNKETTQNHNNKIPSPSQMVNEIGNGTNGTDSMILATSDHEVPNYDVDDQKTSIKDHGVCSLHSTKESAKERSNCSFENEGKKYTYLSLREIQAGNGEDNNLVENISITNVSQLSYLSDELHHTKAKIQMAAVHTEEISAIHYEDEDANSGVELFSDRPTSKKDECNCVLM